MTLSTARTILVAVSVAATIGAAAPTAGDSVGVVDPATGTWYLRDADSGLTTAFYYGNPGDTPMMGDWDCDGVDTPGLHRRSDGYLYLRNTNTQGVADVRFFFGNPGDIPLPGDFDGDGCDTVSVYRPSESRVFIINDLGEGDAGLGAAEFDFAFGDPGDQPFTGDFDGDGFDTVGLHRSSTGLVYYRNSLTGGPAEASFVVGKPGDFLLAGEWAGGPGGGDTVGIFRPAEGTFYLRYSNTPGNGDRNFAYADPGMIPVSGDFGPLPGGGAAPGLGALPRSAWGALPADTAKMKKHTIESMTVHHAGDQTSYTGPQRFRAWQDLHQGRGWGDLAYHYIIGVDGTIYEGRAVDYAGDTGTDYDPTGHFLVVVEGNFEQDQPTEAQLDSLVHVLAWASTAFDVPASTITGHRDHANTVCPGGNLYPYIASGDLQRDVEELLGG